MPTGTQFGNLNRYRRYPFADDADLSCTCFSGGGAGIVKELPSDFLTSFRLVYAGICNVKTVKLVNISVQLVDSHREAVLKFSIFDYNGNRIMALRSGKPVLSDHQQEVTLDPILRFNIDDSYAVNRVTQLSDFDFSNCISVYVKADFSKITSIAGELFDLSCNVDMAPGTILSMKTPCVMSVLDDNGSPIRDQDSIKLVAGSNTRFDVRPGSKTIVISALKGGGEGCAKGMGGVSTIFNLSGSTGLRYINGLSATPSGDITLVGGRDVIISAVKRSDGSSTNVLNIYSKTKNKESAECILR